MGLPQYTRDKRTVETMEKSMITHPKKAKVVLSAGKVMASVFWDAKGIILVDYLKKGETINSGYYCNLLRCLRDEIKE